ncbi:hypothetical protein RHGRI_023173 [Rhododendron griersonianum]|uniref:Alpha-1,3-glucosyltransferase n=1 Tax=Rhododendron griersonianum TaxID=479676 RepID=A0AAV6J493_9ERIC|nr:hypothetical protein RHGRI_023173 [Rhododendron griersonianum]KAG5535309.1 hypothetical protein RHGRI_023173 [Rhododendron griersonianum]
MEKRKRTNALKDDENEDNIWWLVVQRGLAPSFIFISLFALLVRVAVSLHPYSGAGKPPKYGDFEAQRHWMEITLNLPASEWYRNSTANDLSYWGLDYPPLTAYQSYIHGLILRNFLPDSVSLQTSHGHESYLGKLLMRWTVLSSDVLMFFPAVFYFIVVYYSGSRTGCKSDWAWHVAMILLNPCLILIDHGHFQYNCISLGLTIGAVAAILSDKDLLACFLFSLALNHKQMSAYFAPAFFSYLLGKCLRRQNPLLEVLKLGFVVIGTFSIVWWPYLQSVDTFFQVLSRLAPFERGIYEDYVANFWCTSSVLIKWKRLFTIPSLKLLSLGATVSASLPSMVQQIWAPIHEKSILLPLLPASFLAIDEPFLFKWMMHYALLSMFPLMCRDELILPYISLSALFIFLYHAPGGRKEKRVALSPSNLKSFVVVFLVLCSLVLHVVYLVVSPPEKYPFLFEAMIVLLCFSQFLFISGYTNIKQWMTLKDSALENKEKKHL